MLVVIGWVLWLAPIGVFALAYVVGARAGAAAFGALLHYVLIVTAVGSGRLARRLAARDVRRAASRSVRFARAIAPSQALAISTQSSLACLPAMLRAADKLGVPVAAVGRRAAAGGRALPRDRPGDEPRRRDLRRLLVRHRADAGAVWRSASLRRRPTTMGAVSLPGQVSFVTSIAPICLAHGRADRAARAAHRGRDAARHRPHARQCQRWTSPPPPPSPAARLRRRRQAPTTSCSRKAHEISHARPRPRGLGDRHRLHADGPRRQHHLRPRDRRRIDRHHPPRHRSRHHLLRHRRNVRPLRQ